MRSFVSNSYMNKLLNYDFVMIISFDIILKFPEMKNKCFKEYSSILAEHRKWKSAVKMKSLLNSVLLVSVTLIHISNGILRSRLCLCTLFVKGFTLSSLKWIDLSLCLLSPTT